MAPHATTGWVLFVAMCLAGPITGYSACNLASTIWEHGAVKRRDAFAFGVFGGLLLTATLLLVFVQES